MPLLVDEGWKTVGVLLTTIGVVAAAWIQTVRRQSSTSEQVERVKRVATEADEQAQQVAAKVDALLVTVTELSAEVHSLRGHLQTWVRYGELASAHIRALGDHDYPKPPPAPKN